MTSLHSLVRLAPRRPDDTAEDWTDDWDWRLRRRRSLTRRVVAAVIGAAATLVLIVLLVAAHGHYERGREALSAGQYERAAVEFASASVLTVGYRDADALELVAARMATEKPNDVRPAPATWPLRYRVILARALRELRDTDFLRASLSISILRREFPAYPLDLGRHGTRLAEEGAADLLATARQRFADGELNGARRAATASLYLEPDSAEAAELEQRAYRYLSVGPLFDEARALARRGAWHAALDLLERAEATDAGYPGLADLLRQARRAT